jgi:hypothetical protein
MNNTVKIILIVLAALAGLWLLGPIIGLIQALVPLVIIGGLIYIGWQVFGQKSLPGGGRKRLP